MATPLERKDAILVPTKKKPGNAFLIKGIELESKTIPYKKILNDFIDSSLFPFYKRT
jgi:hypothetical protein